MGLTCKQQEYDMKIEIFGISKTVSSTMLAVYLIPATPFEGLVLFYLLTVIYDVTVTIKIYLVT